MGKGYTRFSSSMLQTEGGNIDEISPNPSKKLKNLSSVGKIDRCTSSKRVKLPKKFFDDQCHTVNHVPIPRKLRSAIKQRHYDSVSPLLNQKEEILGLQTPLEVNKDERQHSTISESISEQISKDEEVVIAGLLLLADNKNKNTNEINLKTETLESEGLVKNGLVIEDSNKSTNKVADNKDCKDFKDGNLSKKICSRHVYICQMIKQLQDTEGKAVNSHKESKTDTMKESVAKEATMASMTLFQDQQVPVPPYFGSLLYDPSQWPRPPKDQMWMNPFVAGARYQNLQKGGRETIPQYLASKQLQPSLINVLGSKENGGLFLGHGPSTLNLMCNEHIGSSRSWLNDL